MSAAPALLEPVEPTNLEALELGLKAAACASVPLQLVLNAQIGAAAVPKLIAEIKYLRALVNDLQLGAEG